MSQFITENKQQDYMSLSGRYEGNMLFPIGGKTLLELRIDIDKICNNCPVLNKISGNFYQILSTNSTNQDSSKNIHLESWIADSPTITSSSSSCMEINGIIHYWEKSNYPLTNLKIIVYRIAPNTIEQAEVTITDTLGNITRYICTKKSHYLRDIELEIDIVKSVNMEPILPVYDTHWNINRPPDLSRRILTVDECYREAGINLSVNYKGNIIDDSTASLVEWDDAELYDAMETYYSQYENVLPAWKMWCFICGHYVKNNVLGMMFDADMRFANKSTNLETQKFDNTCNKPERRGFAIFRSNIFFDNLRSQSPINEEQAYTMRQYLRTFVHETGHAFNLVHSWKKDKPSSLSWMNYPGYYPYGPNDFRNNENEYWNNFRFSFDVEELIHMRHGDRSSVIMGGDPMFLEAGTAKTYGFPLIWENGSPLEFLLRSQDYFEFMEPIEIELRLRNLLDFPIIIDKLFNPEFGRVTIFIKKPNENIIKYNPIISKESPPILMSLQPEGQREPEKPDRYNELITITYGKDGFYFNQPGEYLIQAIYSDFQSIIIPSNILRLKIKRPISNAQNKMASDFFTHEVGMNLYLKGSQSPFLSKGKQKLKEICDVNLQNSLGSKIALVLASSENKPFSKIINRKVKQIHTPNSKKTLEISESAKNFYLKAKNKSFNIPYRNIVKIRYDALMRLNKEKEAKDEVYDLYDNLRVSSNQTRKQIIFQLKTSTGFFGGIVS